MEKPDVTGKKFVIMGTAPTWKLAPWQDPDAVIAGLNDAYMLGMPRYDVWYDIHPFDKFVFRPSNQKKIPGFTVPAGAFLRPEGHLGWLAKQTCPVFLHRADPRVPHGQVFPREAIKQAFGNWFDSSPAWMLAHAILLGYKEVHVYGIHLATEMEYIKQKPNMCFLLGLAVGAGVKVVVPRESPLLHSSHEYAYELDPAIPVIAAQRQGEQFQYELDTVEKAFAASKGWQRPLGDPILRARRTWLKAKLMDIEQAVQWETLKKRALAGA